MKMNAISNRWREILGILLFSVLTMISHIPVAANEETHYLESYQATGFTQYTGKETEGFSMMGTTYKYGLEPNNYVTFRQICYNLDGEFDQVTFEVGSTKTGTTENSPALMEILLDGKRSEQKVDLTIEMMTQEVTIDTTGVKQLILNFTRTTGVRDIFYAVGNVVGHGGHCYDYNHRVMSKTPTLTEKGEYTTVCRICGKEKKEEIPSRQYCEPFLEPYSAQGMGVLKEIVTDQSFKVMGRQYQLGIFSVNYAQKNVFFNLGGKYSDFTFTVGHLDAQGQESGTLKIYTNGASEPVKSVPLSWEMFNQTVTINTEGVAQLKMEIISDGSFNSTFYGFFDIHATRITLKEHSFKDGERVEPTASMDGFAQHVCEDCGFTYTEILSVGGQEKTEQSTGTQQASTEGNAGTEDPTGTQQASTEDKAGIEGQTGTQQASTEENAGTEDPNASQQTSTEDKTGTEVTHYLEPYQTMHLTEYNGKETETFSMMGTTYKYGLNPTNYTTFRQAYYNLDGEFDQVTFDVGSTKTGVTENSPALMEIFLDGERSEQKVELTIEMMTQKVTIDTAGVKQLILNFSRTSGSRDIFYAIGNVVGHGGHCYDYNHRVLSKTPTLTEKGEYTTVCRICGKEKKEEIPGCQYCEPFLEPYSAQGMAVMKEIAPEQYFTVMGRQYHQGIFSVSNVQKNVLFNLGGMYSDVTFTVGNLDRSNQESATLKIYTNGASEPVKSVPLSWEMINQTVTINTEGVAQLKMEIITNGNFNSTYYAFFDIHATRITPKEHSFKDGERVEPTASMDGFTQHVCEDCGFTYTEILEAVGEENTEQPTSTQQASTEGKAGTEDPTGSQQASTEGKAGTEDPTGSQQASTETQIGTEEGKKDELTLQELLKMGTGHLLQAYFVGSDGKNYTDSGNNSFEMMGVSYTSGVGMSSSSYNNGYYAEADYNLDGEFGGVKLTVGSTRTSGNHDAVLKIYVDETFVKELQLTPQMITQDVMVSTKGAKQLKVRTYSNDWSYYGVANVTGYGGHTFDYEQGILSVIPTSEKNGEYKYTCSVCGQVKKETIPARAACVPVLSPYSIDQSMKLYDKEGTAQPSFSVMGRKYQLGVTYEGMSDNNVRSMLFNLGDEYRSVTFQVGSMDKKVGYIKETTGYMNIYVNGSDTPVERLPMTLGMNSQSVTLDTDGVVQLKLEFDKNVKNVAVFDIQYVRKVSKTHTFQAKETVQPTASANGYTVYVCADCGFTYTETLQKTGAVSTTTESVKNPAKTTEQPAKSTETQKISTESSLKTTVEKTSISQKKAGKKSISLKWKAVSGAKGYQVRYSLKSSMKGTSVRTVSGRSLKIKKLKGKKKYYIQVRAYKVSASGSKVFGAWSKKVSVKTKK